MQMDTRKLRRIAKNRGTLGVLYVGTILTAHNLFKRKRLMLALGGVGVAALWAMPTVSNCPYTTVTAPLAATDQIVSNDEAAAKYDVVELKPLDGGEFCQPTGINNKGAVVGVSLNSADNIRGVIWDGGVPKDLGDMGSADVAAFGINDKQQAVGWADSGDSLKGFVWNNGKFIDVGDLGYPFTISFGINNRSQAIGISATKDFRLRGFVWESGKLKNIGTLPQFGPSVPSDIADNGTVVGNVYDADGFPAPFAWSDGKMVALPKWKANTVAIATNNDNVTVGIDFDNEGERLTPVIWKRGKAENLPLPSGYKFGIASDINNGGAIVGTIANDRNIVPVLWQNGKIVDLSKQIGSNMQLLFAMNINDKNEITAFAIKGDDFVAVLLKPKSQSAGFEYNETDWETAGNEAIPIISEGQTKSIVEKDFNSNITFHSMAIGFSDAPDTTARTMKNLLFARLRTTSNRFDFSTPAVWDSKRARDYMRQSFSPDASQSSISKN